jgi:hypothetical protein
MRVSTYLTPESTIMLQVFSFFCLICSDDDVEDIIRRILNPPRDD